MGDLTEATEQRSPSAADDQLAAGNNGQAAENRGTKRPRTSNNTAGGAGGAEDDDDDEDKPGRERRKIDIKFITDKSRRHITFSKRKAGIMKKAYELSVLTGTQVLLLVVSETGLVYTFTTPKLQPLVTKSEGKNLIQACLNAPEPSSGDANGVEGDDQSSTQDDAAAHQQMPQQPPMPRNGMPQPPYSMNPSDQALMYQQYMQQQSQGVGGQYPMPPQQLMVGGDGGGGGEGSRC